MQRLFKRADSLNWYVNLGNGIYKSTGCRDRRAAEARAGELERAAHAPRNATSTTTTLSQALGRALADRAQRGRAQGTLDMWKVKGGHLLRLLGAETPVAQIDAAALDDYTSTRTEESAGRGTIGKELGVYSVTLQLARRREPSLPDPATVLPQGWGSDYVPRDRALSPEEMRLVLADLMDDALPMVRGKAGPERGDHSRRPPTGPTSTYARTRQRSMRERAARVAWIVATSGRWSESERARREDIDWRTGLVLVRGTKTRKSLRYVPILPTTAPLLRLALEHGRDEGLLFVPWGNVRRDLHAMCARLEIEPVSPNDLRRTTGAWLRAAGVEPHLIGEVLGHEDARMAERVYGVLPPDALKALLLERLGGVVPLLPAASSPATRTTAPATKQRKAGGT